MGRHRIGLLHGKRRSTDALVVAAHAAAGRRLGFDAGRAAGMARAFDGYGVDCVVFGHWHQAVAQQVDDVLVVNPGAVCPWGSLQGGREPRAGAAGVADRVVRRYRRQLGAEAMQPSVARLHLDDTITAEIVPLPVESMAG